LVLSEGILTTLTDSELAAVLAHERAHLRERHDLVVLPFVAWGATAAWVPGMAKAQAAVAALVEMRADDVANAHVGSAALAGALRRVNGAGSLVSDQTLGSFSSAVTGRLDRLDQHRSPPPWFLLAAPRLAALALVAVPTVVLLRP
jgi:Zn-dependent protease with chaperone function